MFLLECPNCFTAEELRRSRKRFQDWPLFLIRLEPYRCMGCYHRFYAFRWISNTKRDRRSE